MKKAFNTAIIALLLLTTFSACKQKDDEKVTASGKTYLEFFSTVGGINTKMDGTWYKNENADSFTVTKFNYYISNIKLNGDNGQTYTEADSYHLIQQDDATTQAFNMSNVPNGKYNSITFMIGVDSLHNVSGAQTGDLAETKGMFWGWNTGYIMLKFEGNSPKSPQSNGMIMMHAGGFSGAKQCFKNSHAEFPGCHRSKGWNDTTCAPYR